MLMVHELRCDRCMQVHQVEVELDALTPEQRRGEVPVLDNYVCPRMALMYRVVSFALDTRSQALKGHPGSPWALQMKESLIEDWGARDSEEKIARFIDLGISLLGLPEEYYYLLNQIISAHCCGHFYPAMTAAGSLGERILNRLILRTRGHFKGHRTYKRVWNKDSFDNWDVPIDALREWGVITDEVAGHFGALKEYRNDSIHYNEGYDFAGNSQKAVSLLGDIVCAVFGYTHRKDLFWIFDVPGEIWLRTSVEDDPFVKEFILDHCVQATAYCEPLAAPPVKGTNVPLKPISDEEFLRKRRRHKEEAANEVAPGNAGK